VLGNRHCSSRRRGSTAFDVEGYLHRLPDRIAMHPVSRVTYGFGDS
jgi:hypothetical protein